jgi:hypothetical protein
MLPLGCLPRFRQRGVTLRYTREDWQATGKRGFLQSTFLPERLWSCTGQIPHRPGFRYTNALVMTDF